MASAAPAIQSLPLFYQGIEPLNVSQHGNMKVRSVVKMGQIGTTHAIPLTVDEFTLVQRHYPIVFSIGENPIPMALMGLNEGVNVFLTTTGARSTVDVHPGLHPPLSFPACAPSPGQRRAVVVLRSGFRRGRRL